MTTKSKNQNKSSTKKPFTSETRENYEPRLDRRKELLARVAGSIAAGLVTSPSPLIATASGMAAAAVDIADEILKTVGIPTDESSAESTA